ncbi:hypothetical protein B4V02_15695 [Paenibacillus kribbensis]|uniref:Uncharacterized protein n=1 Tax=Paenibacillus kribbensis TaxID=172713 RepID=A0A222WQ94_9BACL|nr:hypothetical protein B4V02_15695 [Paenibacillus kribbensis]
MYSFTKKATLARWALYLSGGLVRAFEKYAYRNVKGGTDQRFSVVNGQILLIASLFQHLRAETKVEVQ